MDNSLTKLINNSSKLIGTRQVLKAVINGKITQVIIAADADDRLKEQVAAACKQGNIPILSTLSKCELGKLCKIQVPCAVIGIVKN